MANYYLEETDESTEAIAEKVGYGSKSAFYHAYCSFYGQPPGAFRRETTDKKV